MKKLSVSVLLLYTILVVIGHNSTAENARYQDGVYEGEHSFVKARVTIVEGRIDNIKILEHGGGGKKYAEMVEPLCAEMVSGQTVDVDTVTVATVSSDNLKEAVKNALRKAK